MTVTVRFAVAAALAVLTVAVGVAVDTDPVAALGPSPVTVVVDLDHSRMQPDALRVWQGTRVQFVVINRDPINHELIVGPPEVHDRHRDGTEKEHPPVDGEVSVPALERRTTSYTFDEVGSVEMACHLPGHYEYGMRGAVQVVPAT